MAATSKNDKQVMDISKPGKSAPSATAKPVIVGHRPMVQDPMVTADAATEVESEKSAEITPVPPTKKIIAPLTSEQDQASPSDESSKPDLMTKEQTPSTNAEDTALVDTVIDQVADKKATTELTEEDKKKLEHIEKLVTEKKYFVPLGKVNGKKSHTGLWVTFVLAVILLGLVAALDAAILDIGITLPFDFL